jgi:nicotinamidase-related amidase
MGIQNDVISWNSKKLKNDLSHEITQINKNIIWALENDWLVVYNMELYHPRHTGFNDSNVWPYCVLQTWGAQIHHKIHIPPLKHYTFYNTRINTCTSHENKLVRDAFYNSYTSSNDYELSNLKQILDSINCKTVYICGFDMYDNNSIKNTYETALLLKYQCTMMGKEDELMQLIHTNLGRIAVDDS